MRPHLPYIASAREFDQFRLYNQSRGHLRQLEQILSQSNAQFSDPSVTNPVMHTYTDIYTTVTSTSRFI